MTRITADTRVKSLSCIHAIEATSDAVFCLIRCPGTVYRYDVDIEAVEIGISDCESSNVNCDFFWQGARHPASRISAAHVLS